LDSLYDELLAELEYYKKRVYELEHKGQSELSTQHFTVESKEP